jgi:hypothetical protein
MFSPAAAAACVGTAAGILLTLAIWLLGRRVLVLARPGGAWTSTRIVETAACGLGILAAAWLIAAVIAGAIATFTANHPKSRAHQAALTIAPASALRFYTLAAGIGLALTALAATAPPIRATPIALEPADVPIGLLRQPNAMVKDPALAAASSLATADSSAINIPLSGVSSSPGLPTPSVPPTQSAPAAPQALTDSLVANNTVVVQPGDSLWQLAAASLPPEATSADIAAAWPAWYELNADTIGSDPNLIQPGQVLRIPTQS